MSTKAGGGMLVAAPARWDEACFAVPAVRALVATGFGTGIVCEEDRRGFWETIPNLTVIDHPRKIRIRALAEKIGPDWKAALVWELGTAADAIAHAGVPSRIGPDEKALRKRLTNAFTRDADTLDHRVRHYLVGLEELGIDTSRPAFFASADLGIPPETGVALLCPDSDFGPTHEWPLDRWTSLGKALSDTGLRLTVAGLPRHRDLGKKLAAALGEETLYFDADPMAASLPLLAVHSLVVTADSSLAHLTAHVGATCVTLFGPNDPAWKRPLGRRHSVIRRHVECAPCFLAKCPLDLRCQKELTVERVLAAVRAKLE